MQALGMNVIEFFMILSLNVLCQNCVSLIFGEVEYLNARLNHKFGFIVFKSFKK